MHATSAPESPHSHRRPWPLAGHIAAAVGAALLANLLLIVENRGQFAARPPVRFSPPGYVIGTVWMVLFGFMGAAYHTVALSPATRRRTLCKALLIAVILLCALYPTYTDQLRSLTLGLAGAIAVLALALISIAFLFHYARRAAYLLVPLRLWLGFASYLIVAQLRAGFR